jgi:putative flippase GtrA
MIFEDIKMEKSLKLLLGVAVLIIVIWVLVEYVFPILAIAAAIIIGVAIILRLILGSDWISTIQSWLPSDKSDESSND